MKDRIKQIASVPKKVANHVYARRGRYAATAGFIAGAVVIRKLDIHTRAEAIAFIEQKGLSDEFFLNAEDFAEMAK